MRFSLALILGLLVVSAFAQDVVVLNSDNFDDIVTSHDLVLVEFFAPWCGHCKQLAPKFATAAETLAAEGITNAILASVDCTIETDLASRYKIEGYPTLLAFKKDPNNGTPYNGAREVDALVSYIKKKSAPAVSSVATVADLDALASKGGSIVLFGGSADDVSAFTSAADADEAHSYFHVSDESVIVASRTTAPAIKLFRSFSDTPAVLSEFPVTAAAIAEFVDANGYPLVSEINQDSYQRLAKKPHPLMILVLDTEVDTKDGFLATWNTLAAEFPSLSFTYGPSAQLINAVKQFGGTGNVLPSIIGFRVPGMADVESSLPDRFAWPESEAFSESTARAWLTTVVAGSPAVHKKSEPIPADNSAPVKILVADNFSELVLNSNKYVLVKFYAPWCGHCKNLAPIYDELAEKLVGQDTIVIGKMDATENWVDPTFNVQGFPTIYLVTPNKAAHILFDGERTVDGFLQFLEQHTGLSLGGGGGGGSDDKAAHDEL